MEIDNNVVHELKLLGRDSPEFSKKCALLSQDIKSGGSTISVLVEQLGPLLVDTSPNNRELGTWVLARVLGALPSNHLDQKQLEFISAFYSDRFKDHHQVIPAVLVGVLALSKFERFPNGAAKEIISALFQNVACQQQKEEDRLNIYMILSTFLEKYGHELQEMGFDFVYGVISAVDGERNPKNLIFLFQWFPKFLTSVTLGHLTEEAFEVLACYFPVDFKAPAQDSTEITREQLATALAPCLSAIPQFSDYCFTLALEKLDSSLEVAKLDSLHLLEIGCTTFETSSYSRHSTEIWTQIQREVFSNQNTPIEAAALAALTAIVRKLTDDPNLKTSLKDLVDTLKGNLIPDAKLFESSTKLLLSVASASSSASDLVTKEIVPILINTYNITKTNLHRTVILRALVSFFISYVGVHDQIEFDELRKVPLLCLKASRDDSDQLRGVAFDGLRLSSLHLSPDVRLSLYEIFNIAVSTEVGARKPMLCCFETFASNFSLELHEHVVRHAHPTDGLSKSNFFDALISIASHDFFTEIVIEILLQDLNQINIKALKQLTEKYENNDKISGALLEKNVINVLIQWYQQQQNIETEVLENIAFVLKSVIGVQTVEKQNDIVQHFQNFDFQNPSNVFIVYGLLSRIRPDVDIDYRILNELMNLASSDSSVKTIAAQLLANILNKCKNEEILLGYLAQFEQKTLNFELLSWVTKALVMRNHPQANIWTEKLLGRLDVEPGVAMCFRVIINDSYDALSPKTHCRRTVLYQQKFFTIVTKRLSDNYDDHPSYLLALGYLLESAPKQVVLLQFKKILKLIVLCMDQCPEPEVLITILRIIKEFVENSEKCIEDQVGDFLARFSKLALFEKSLRVRILAVECLCACVHAFPVYKLLMHKQEVLRVLGKVVDDRKRIVRRGAMEARSLWYLLDAEK